MKILHIIPTYSPAWRRGGPIVSVHNLNKWLVKKGLSVTVFTTNIDTEGKVPLATFKNGEIQNIQSMDGVKVCFFRASFPRIWEYWRVGFLPAFLPRHWEYSRDLHQALQKTAKQFDIIHITSTFLFASTLGVFYANKFKKPSIISPRGNLMEPLELKATTKKRMYIKLIEKRNLKDASAIHFTVPKELDEYKWHKLTLRKSIVIPNGLDFADINYEEVSLLEMGRKMREKWGLDDKKKIVLFLGRLDWKKGLDTLFSAFSKLIKINPQIVLVLVGGDEGGYRKKLKEWISDYKIGANVVFAGMLLGKEKYAAYEAADIFTLTSYSENFGMSVVEAMAFKVPVVITKTVGIAPYVREAQAGIVIEKDEGECVKAILEILNNPVQARKMGECGRKLTEEKFMMPKIADQWVEAYKGLLQK